MAWYREGELPLVPPAAQCLWTSDNEREGMCGLALQPAAE
jgi:hypothetical protein